MAKRYEARIDGGAIGTFDEVEQALAAMADMMRLALRHGRPTLPELTDTYRDVPFDEQAIWDWFDMRASVRPHR